MVKRPPSTDARFSPTWKAVITRQFQVFVKGGFKKKDFPPWFYNRISHMFGMIAHFDIDTFYDTFFQRLESRIVFLARCLIHEPVGDPAVCDSDIERELQDWLRKEDTFGYLQRRLVREKKKKEQELFIALKAKYDGHDDDK